MKNLARTVGMTLAAIVGLFAVLLLAVNMYVQSQTTHTRIERELSQRLGTTVKLRTISVTPWGGLRLSGITIPQAGDRSAKFLQAETFRLRIHFPSLFQQRLVIKEISLVRPSVVWLQNADGKWRLPGTEAAATEAVPPAATPESALTNATPVPESSAAAVVAVAASPTPEPTSAAFKPELRRVNLVGGTLRFLDRQARPVATFDGVQFRSNFRNAADVRGDIAITKTSLRDRFLLENLRARLSYGPAALELANVSASAAGGALVGSFSMQPQTPDSPFTVNVTFHDVQADQLVKEAGGPPGTIGGTIEGFLDASGKTADGNALAGNGEIVVHGGELRQYSVLEALGEILQIEELRQLKLDEAHAKYHITPGVVVVDEIVLRSPNIRLTGVGTIGFDGALRINSQLAINDKIRRQLFRAVRDNFQPVADSDYAAVDFQISGTIDHPTSNVLDKIVGGDARNIGGMINTLLGGRSERKKKRNDEHSPAAQTPAPPSATPQS